MKKFLFLFLLTPLILLGQANQTITLQVPSPPGLSGKQVGVNASSAGIGIGINQWCYWVIAKYPIGNSAPSTGSCVQNVSNVAGTTITISWSPVTPPATGYDILRDTINVFPAQNSCASCLISSNQSGNTYVDNLAAGSSYNYTIIPSYSSVSTLDQTIKNIPQVLNNTYWEFPGICFSDLTCFTTAPSSGGITQLTGDVTAGPGSGSQVSTLATVNSGPGLCGDSSHVCQITTNGKGLTTLQTPVSITAVTSFSGDGALLSNSSSTGGVTATLANTGGSDLFWGKNGASGTPGYNSIGTSAVSPHYYATGGGTANAQTVTLSPAATALTAGMVVRWLPTANNTTTTPTLAVNGLTATTITKFGNSALVASDLTTTAIATAIYDGTTFELQNPQTSSSLTINATSIASALVGTGGGTAQAQTITLSATPASLAAIQGVPICYLPSVANTGAAPTISINGLTATAVTKIGAQALISHDLITTSNACVVYNGTSLEMLNPATGFSSATPINTNIPRYTAADNGILVNSALTDTGTILNYSGTTIQISTANGGLFHVEGTAPAGQSTRDGLYADSTWHGWAIRDNGSSLSGYVVKTENGNIATTGLTASVSTATLCAASAGACNQTGLYHIHLAMEQGGSACSANTTNGVSFQLTWTDRNGNTHSAQTMPIVTNASNATFATSGVLAWNASTLGAWASGDFTISTNGTIIQYATTYANCTTGTATYSIGIAVTRIGT